jgi:hypothetical protein
MLSIQQAYDICRLEASRVNVDPVLAMAVVLTESGCDDQAVRLENGFYRRYMAKQTFTAPVKILLSTSYGLMQTMGETLRTMGYFPPIMDSRNVAEAIDRYLASPQMQVAWGCQFLSSIITRKQGDIVASLLTWNGGADPEYPARVFSKQEFVSEAIKSGKLK